MAGRKVGDEPLPDFLKPATTPGGAGAGGRGRGQAFRWHQGCRRRDLRGARPHAARADRAQRRRQDHGVQSGLRHVPARQRHRSGWPASDISGLPPGATSAAPASAARSRSPTCFRTLPIEENIRLAVQARHPRRFDFWTHRARHRTRSRRRRRRSCATWASPASSSARPARSPTAASAWSTWGSRWRPGRAFCCSMSRSPGLAAAERERIGALIKKHLGRSAGAAGRARHRSGVPPRRPRHRHERRQVLLDGSVEDARSSKRVQEVYIGSGAAHVAAQAASERGGHQDAALTLDRINTFYGKSHILNDVSLEVREHEIVALLGRNGAGKSTLLKSLVGIAPPASGIDQACRRRARSAAVRAASRASAWAMCPRAAACSPA